jgi:hypothetical protein
MLLVWRGLGPIVLLIGGAGFVAAVIIGEVLKIGVAGENVLAGLAMIPSGYAIWRIGKRWNRPVRELVDPATGERVVLKPGHSLFFIPIEWWGPIVIVLGVWYAIATLAGPR